MLWKIKKLNGREIANNQAEINTINILCLFCILLYPLNMTRHFPNSLKTLHKYKKQQILLISYRRRAKFLKMVYNSTQSDPDLDGSSSSIPPQTPHCAAATTTSPLFLYQARQFLRSPPFTDSSFWYILLPDICMACSLTSFKPFFQYHSHFAFLLSCFSFLYGTSILSNRV